MMNRLNWIQQEQKVADYHVITWRTSHFHNPRNRTVIGEAAATKQESSVAAASGVQNRADGIGMGPADKIKSGEWKTGGLGLNGVLEDGKKTGKDNVVLSALGRKEGQQSMMTQQAVVQPVLLDGLYGAVDGVRQAVMKVRSRIRQSAARFRSLHKNEPKQGQGHSVKQGLYHNPSKKEYQGTRKANKDQMLAMQAENHYLLDSYDKSGQYSMLGKS